MDNRFKISNRFFLLVLLVSIVLFSARLYFTGNLTKIINTRYGVKDILDERIIKDEDYKLDNIKKIYTNINVGSIYLFSTDNDKARVVISKNGNMSNGDVKIEKKDNQLNIEANTKDEKSIKIGFLFNFNIAMNRHSDTGEKYTVKLYIPKKYNNDIELKSKVGNIDVKNIVINNLKSKVDVGEIEGNNIKSKNTDLKVSTGKIELKKFSGKLNCDNSIGDIKVECSQLVNDIDITNSTGEINLYIPEKSDFILNAKTQTGDIKNEFQSMDMNEKREVVKESVSGKTNSGKHNINLKNSLGEIKILKTN